MQYLGWIAAVAFLVAAVVAVVGRRARVAALIEERDRALTRANELAVQVGRVPDLERRASEADAETQSLRQALGAAQTRVAGTEAKLEAADEARAAAEQLARADRDARAAGEQALNDARVETASLTAALAAANGAVEQVRADVQAREGSIVELNGQLQEQQRLLNEAVAQRASAVEQLEQTRSFLERAQENLRGSFLDITNKLMDEKSAANKVSLEETLKPFTEQLAVFQARNEQLSSDQAKDTARLEGKIGELTSLNQHMANTTDSLTRALKGNAKVRGDWGEMILETVLRNCGLEENKNYRRQASTVDDDSGRRRFPDVVVDLPDGRQIVVDSKVNLLAWAAYGDADTAEAQQEALIQHTTAMRAHVRDLADKAYPKLVGPGALDMTIMFVPIEGALAAALSTTPDLQSEAWAKRIVFASPNTFMALLKVVERLWMRDRIQKQVETIATEAGKLLDAVIGFLEDFGQIETRLVAMEKSVRDARNRLDSSPQSVLNRAKRLVEAGAKGRKVIPDELISAGGDQPLALTQDGGALVTVE